MIIPVSLSIYMDRVLKCKLGHFILMDFSKFKQIIKFSFNQLSFYSGILMQPRDIGYDLERLIFTKENLTLFTFLTNAHYSAY